MAAPYTRPTLSGFNASPPPDDGSTGSDNTVTWAKHKQKLADPLKTFMEAVDENVFNAFANRLGNAVRTDNTAATLGSDDEGKLVSVTGTTTITLPDATVVSSNWLVMIRNNGSNTVTVDGNGSQTINGSANITLNPGASAIAVSDGANFRSLHAPGILTADADGLANMADSFLSADAAGRAKMADSFLSADAAGRAKMADSFVVTAKVGDTQITDSKIDWSTVSGSIGQTQIAASGVGQSELKTSESTNSSSIAGSGSAGQITVPGGSYSFYPRYWQDSSSFDIIFGQSTSSGNQTIRFQNNDSSSKTANVRSRFVQSSPPYDLGDGVVHGFVYARLNSAGNIIGVFISEDPAHYGTTFGGTPTYFKRNKKLYGRWRRPAVTVRDVIEGRASHNGFLTASPIVEELEVTPATKLRGMDERPHPWVGELETGESAVLLDPMSDNVELLIRQMLLGDNVADLLFQKHLTVDNEQLTKRSAPPGVPIHAAKWRLT